MRQTVQELVARYQNNLFAVAFNVCKNAQDAEDVVQDTFLQYYTMKKEFDNEQHIRAWLIRVAVNKAKNCNRTFWRRNKCSFEEYMETLTFETPQSESLFETVMQLRKNIFGGRGHGKIAEKTQKKYRSGGSSRVRSLYRRFGNRLRGGYRRHSGEGLYMDVR